MLIRRARPDDAGAIQAIYAPFVEETTVTFEEVVPDAAEMASRIASTSMLHPYIVLEVDGAVLGYAYASALRTRAAYRWAAELSIYMGPDARGKGLGKSLYTTLIALLKAQGICVLYGALVVPNAASERLHETMGFTEVGMWHRCGFKHGQWLDVRWYERWIADSDGAPAPVIPFPDLPPEIVNHILGQGTERIFAGGQK